MISEELNRGNKPRGVHPYIILGCGDESWPPPGPDSLPRGKTHPHPHTMGKKGGGLHHVEESTGGGGDHQNAPKVPRGSGDQKINIFLNTLIRKREGILGPCKTDFLGISRSAKSELKSKAKNKPKCHQNDPPARLSITNIQNHNRKS